jgi:neopullulanase
MRMRNLLLLLLLGFSISTKAQNDTIDPEQRIPFGVVKPMPKRISATATTAEFKPSIAPHSWWVGFKNSDVELMIHDKSIGEHTVRIAHKGLKIKSIHRPENKNYLFVTLTISPKAAIGNVKIMLEKGSDKRSFDWQIMNRTNSPSRNQGLATSDFVYLIMPDRFANGDPTNDDVEGMNQRGIDRRKMFFRHGGDLKGIENNFDYFQELGVTALWLNPVQENDGNFETYHGYAASDLYHIDRRLGTNDQYKLMVEKMQARKMKMVMDAVPNHLSDETYFIKDLPESDFIHQFDTFTRTNYRDQLVFDPYVAASERNILVNGWFDVHMPDVNTNNVHMANYIIQNHIWWLEFAGVDAYRIDTYLYNDPIFMANWAAAIRREFPKVTLFGETWVTGIINQAYSTEKVALKKGFDSQMHGVTDFQLYFAIQEALTREQGWSEGIMRLYQNLSNDFIYHNANQNVTFIDNHDVARFYSTVGENMAKYKSAIAWLLTCRGIPQWYYGAELGFTGFTNPDGKVRQDMPGGWKEDTRSVFKAQQRTEKENEIFDYTKRLAIWRKTKTCLHDGKLTQFLPVDGVYAYFRHDSKSSVMVVMNTSDKDVVLDTKRFSERMVGYNSATNVATGQNLASLKTLNLAKFETLVLDLKN